MEPEDIAALRKELECNRVELAEALGVEPQLIADWEKERKFPTKKHVRRMDQLREKGPDAVPRKRKKVRLVELTPMQLLARPELWAVIRKLLAHPELLEEVTELADGYEDP